MSGAASDRYVVPGLARGLRFPERFDRTRLIAEVVEPERETSHDLSRNLGWGATGEDGAAFGHG